MHFYLCTLIYYDGVIRFLTRAEDKVMARSACKLWLTQDKVVKPLHIITDRLPVTHVGMYLRDGQPHNTQFVDVQVDERRVHG